MGVDKVAEKIYRTSQKKGEKLPKVGRKFTYINDDNFEWKMSKQDGHQA